MARDRAALYWLLPRGYDPYLCWRQGPRNVVGPGRLPAHARHIGLLLHATLYFRQLLATLVLVLEGRSPLAALRRSRTLSRGRHPCIAALVAEVALTVAAVPLA